MDAPHYVVNAEAAVHRDGEYLLVERAAAEEHGAGALALVGGKVEVTEGREVLEATVRREVAEEVGVTVGSMEYVTNSAFETPDDRVVNTVFLAEYDAGTARVRDPEEVAAVHWLSPAEVRDHPDAPQFTADYVDAVEAHRVERQS
ncbi:NUDIX domain-containing protein [Salarchaeum sp. JOR-1]|uniref:NUDIX domain-containing protein n=1 Tax=Salarchaeum sp. JOR-1 TaxID=2599399 RepID=UPI001198689D|nr:NUDIX domain-containing protein [Salarchaeum sp. JOR-1]QDX40732.1 NUDIX domain-containing protein [Salarchaeum sp. JOR-1]